MPFTFDLRARPLLVVLLCVVAAAAVGLFMLERSRSSSDSASGQSASTTTAARHAAPKPAPVHRAAPAGPKPKPSVAASDRLPAPIRRAFADDRVVVVALYDPRAKIDSTALAEARAGTRLTDAVFVPIDVRKNAVDSLNARYGVTEDPAVLVLKPSGQLVVRIDGFADRDTVAQAAADAES